MRLGQSRFRAGLGNQCIRDIFNGLKIRVLAVPDSFDLRGHLVMLAFFGIFIALSLNLAPRLVNLNLLETRSSDVRRSLIL
jgi:hypothetical protein